MSHSDGSLSSGTAFLLWLACVFGFCGIHRFYLGRPVTGFLYLITFGFFGIGQLVDLFRLPTLVRQENLKLQAGQRRSLLAAGELAPRRSGGDTPIPETPEAFRKALLKAAAAAGGALTVAQGVLATGRDFAEVESMLDDMAARGYVGIDNDPDTGSVIYAFGDLAAKQT
jgi:hypothetical protein